MFPYLTMNGVDQYMASERFEQSNGNNFNIRNSRTTFTNLQVIISIQHSFNDETSINLNNPTIPGKQFEFNFPLLLLYFPSYYFKITFTSPRDYASRPSSRRKFCEKLHVNWRV